MRQRSRRAVAAFVLIAGLAGLTAALISMRSAIDYMHRHTTVAKRIRAALAGAVYVGSDGVVFQRRFYDCGAASLKMILDAHGVRRDLGEVERATRTTRQGASLLNLRLAAKEYGLDARAWSLTADDLTQAPLPAIAFVGGDHYVVVRRRIDQSALLVDDPAIGRLRWPLKSFRKTWSGETLIFDPQWQPPGLTRISELCRNAQ